LQREDFFFQEGQAVKYQKARYGESSLVDLRDGQLKRLGPSEGPKLKQNS